MKLPVVAVFIVLGWSLVKAYELFFLNPQEYTIPRLYKRGYVQLTKIQLLFSAHFPRIRLQDIFINTFPGREA